MNDSRPIEEGTYWDGETHRMFGLREKDIEEGLAELTAWKPGPKERRLANLVADRLRRCRRFKAQASRAWSRAADSGPIVCAAESARALARLADSERELEAARALLLPTQALILPTREGTE